MHRNLFILILLITSAFTLQLIQHKMSEFFNPFFQWQMIMMQYCMSNNYFHFQRSPQSTQLYPAFPTQQIKIEQPKIVSQKRPAEVAKQPIQISRNIIKQQQNHFDFQRQLVQTSAKKTHLNRKTYDSKNTETNIINQVFCFLLYRKKSLQYVQKLCKGNTQKVQVFYKYMITIKRSKRKYANKQYFNNLVHLPEKSGLFELILRSHRRAEILDVQELRSIIRRLVLFFLRSHLCHIIMNSSKFAVKTRYYHMQKITELKKIIYKAFQT